MTLGIFQRAMQRGLAKLGEPSFLAGVPCGNVHLERDVQVFASLMDEANDNYTVPRDVVTIDKQFTPKAGQTLQHPDGWFRLDKLVEDNGYSRRFTVVAIPAPATP